MIVQSSPAERRDILAWASVVVAAAAIAVVVWVVVTLGVTLVHLHPAYPVVLGVALVLAALALWRNFVPRVRKRGWPAAARAVTMVLAAAGVATIAWLKPFAAVQPALAAMRSDAYVRVTETATQITMAPWAATAPAAQSEVGVFFQPGALVDARAYAAVLRPLAWAGHTVVIAKQPLNIAFLATGAFDVAREAHPAVTSWVLGGHSLGGTVAAMQADSGQNTSRGPAVGLLLYASYPAGNLRSSLHILVESISGSRDGLATPAKISMSRSDLPVDTRFTVIRGASHAQFGSYGPQPGDREPTITDEDARTQIAAASLSFVAGMSAGGGKGR
ncbi:alpha/beta hydrolase [Microbacterium sp.]|uniref:alpha/beta hydrolase n=1 Tax=Microbacterium sp. TaxID=51671 RepID=UPI003A93FA5C